MVSFHLYSWFNFKAISFFWPFQREINQWSLLQNDFVTILIKKAAIVTAFDPFDITFNYFVL